MRKYPLSCLALVFFASLSLDASFNNVAQADLLTFTYAGTVDEIEGFTDSTANFEQFLGAEFTFQYTFDSELSPSGDSSESRYSPLHLLSVQIGEQAWGGTDLSEIIVSDTEYTVASLVSGPSVFDHFPDVADLRIGNNFSSHDLPLVPPVPGAGSTFSLSFDNVDRTDLIIIRSSSVSSVPEPSVFCVFCLGTLMLASRRRRIADGSAG